MDVMEEIWKLQRSAATALLAGCVLVGKVRARDSGGSPVSDELRREISTSSRLCAPPG